MREQTMLRRLSPLLALALLVAMALTACATSSVARAPAMPSISATLQPTKVAVKAGDTGFCNIVSPAEFTRVSGDRATQVTPGATEDSLTQLQEVFCIYADASDPQQLVEQGTINFERANDAQAAAAVFQTLKQSFAGVNDVPGVGDGAFSGTPGGLGSGAGIGLIVVSGPLLLYLSVGGDPATVTRVTRQLAALVLSRVE